MNRLVCKPGSGATTTILIGSGLRFELASHVETIADGRRVVALVDAAVAASHPDLVADGWQTMQVQGGENCKTLATLDDVLRQFARWQLDRRSILVAIGGGTIGDLGGLAASLFLRGIELIQVPTTLLAMLDSSVGGKTAINLPEGKNLVGTFWPPRLMLADVDLAATLPEAHLLSGLGEALKMGIGFNAELFELLEGEHTSIRAGDPTLLAKIVTMAVQDKITTVESDPKETTGRRRCLNLGHTLAHALEALSGYTTLHGHAVARGLHFALDIAVQRGVMQDQQADRCHALINTYGFVADPLPAGDQLLPFFRRDKKMEGGLLHMVLPTAIGACSTFPMRPEELVG